MAISCRGYRIDTFGVLYRDRLSETYDRDRNIRLRPERDPWYARVYNTLRNRAFNAAATHQTQAS